MDLKESKFKIIVKTRSNKNELVCFDTEKNAYILKINAIPEKGEANKELIRFLSKMLKKQVRIVSGFTSKEKIIEVI